MTKSIDIAVEGMHCGACATGIQMVTSGLEGVSSSFVDYNKKTGSIAFDPDKITQETIFEEITKLGYQVSEANTSAVSASNEEGE